MRFEGLNLTGTVTVHTERPRKELLWHDGDEKYYPKGVDDPDYCVLEFAADGGSYYRFDGKGTLSREETETWDRDRSFADTYALTHAAGEP